MSNMIYDLQSDWGTESFPETLLTLLGHNDSDSTQFYWDHKALL